MKSTTYKKSILAGEFVGEVYVHIRYKSAGGVVNLNIEILVAKNTLPGNKKIMILYIMTNQYKK